MNKYILPITAVLLVSTIVNPSVISASLVTIQPNGNTVWNVLGAETDGEKIQVKKVAMIQNGQLPDTVQVQKEGDEIQVKMQKDGKTQVANATDYKDTLVEIEARDDTRKVKILAKDGKFILQESGLDAVTEYPVEIDATEAKIGVKAPSGLRYLEVLPYEAFQTLVKGRALDDIESGDTAVVLTENDAGELHYVIKGEKELDLKVYKVNVPVTATISATTGKLLTVDAPIWFKVVGFFIS